MEVGGLTAHGATGDSLPVVNDLELGVDGPGVGGSTDAGSSGGPIGIGRLRSTATRNYRRVDAECRIHNKDVGNDESGRNDLP